MPDYLSQLALRVKQSEFAVQPRPVSRFESQRYAIPMAPEPSTSQEVDELGLQSANFIPVETTADRRTQPVDSRTHREPNTLASLSEAQFTTNDQNQYPRQSATKPAIVTPETSTKIPNSPVIEAAHPAPRRPQAEQSPRIVRSAVAQAQPSGRIDRLEQQTSKASSDPSGRRERSEFTDLVAQRKNEWRPSIVQIENPKGEERPSSPSARTLNHKEIGTFSVPTETEPLFGRKVEVTTKFGLAPVPRREYPQPLNDRRAPEFGMVRATDAPTIQVTIGRVEIRATVASTPTRKTPTHTPAMSLDEYLKQRNGSRG